MGSDLHKKTDKSSRDNLLPSHALKRKDGALPVMFLAVLVAFCAWSLWSHKLPTCVISVTAFHLCLVWIHIHMCTANITSSQVLNELYY